MSLEKLKLLTPKSTSLERSGGRGKDALSWEDIAAALSKAPALTSLYARVCYGYEHSSIEKLEYKIFHQLVENQNIQDHLVRLSTLKKLVRLAVIEQAFGRQFPVKDTRMPADKIRILNLKNPSMWYRKYADVYAEVQNVFSALEREAFTTLKYNLSD